MHIVCLATVPYTGTHFLKAFLEEFNQLRLTIDLNDLAARPYILEPARQQLVWGHISQKTLECINGLSRHWKIIISIRDPLASMISLKQRDQKYSANLILETWKTTITEGPRNVKFVPLDTGGEKSLDGRKAILKSVVKAAGLFWSPNAEAVCDAWAEKWPSGKHNSQGVYPAKIKYYEEDVPFLTKFLGPDWNLLLESEYWIRPFLEEQGYKDLLWWSTPSLKTAA